MAINVWIRANISRSLTMQKTYFIACLVCARPFLALYLAISRSCRFFSNAKWAYSEKSKPIERLTFPPALRTERSDFYKSLIVDREPLIRPDLCGSWPWINCELTPIWLLLGMPSWLSVRNRPSLCELAGASASDWATSFMLLLSMLSFWIVAKLTSFESLLDSMPN